MGRQMYGMLRKIAGHTFAPYLPVEKLLQGLWEFESSVAEELKIVPRNIKQEATMVM